MILQTPTMIILANEFKTKKITKEEIKERIAVMQAYVDGKEIEFYNYSNKEWVVTKDPLWDIKIRYRVQPMQKYRPFQSAEECRNEMVKHDPIGYLKSNNGYVFVCSFSDEGVYFSLDHEVSFEDAFGVNTFADGKPFGVIEEESK